jgi:hypothetical protein
MIYINVSVAAMQAANMLIHVDTLLQSYNILLITVAHTTSATTVCILNCNIQRRLSVHCMHSALSTAAYHNQAIQLMQMKYSALHLS